MTDPVPLLERLELGLHVTHTTQAFQDEARRQFRSMAHNSQKLDLPQFEKVIESKSDWLAQRLFDVIDANGNGCITEDEFVAAMTTLQCGSLEERMWFAFKLYDVDGHGFISKEESLRVLQEGCKESGLRISESALHELNERLFEQADRQGQGILTFEAFQALLMDHSELVGRMTLSSTRLDWADTLNTHQQPKMSRCKRFAALLMKRRWVRRLAALTLWIFNNPQRAFCLLALALVILGTFLWRFIEYALMEKRLALMGWSLPLAKGFGQALKFIWALILFPVCRLAATSLRESWLRHIIPFDDAIYFHKILGVTGLLFAWGHAFCHISNIVRAVDPDRRQLYAEAFPPDPTTWTPTEPTAKAFLSSWVFITGVLMLAILCIAYAFALDWPRKSKRIRDTAIGKVLNNFNNFWLTHHLFILFYALLIMHPLPGKPPEAYDWGQGETWLYIMVPMVLYAAERLIRSARSHARATQVVGAQRLTKDVFMVKVSKPKRFHYSCGHYAFLQCPEISFYEWHPFTISSAPEDECLTFHIRAAGDWTSALAQHIQRALDEPSTEIDKQAASQDIETGEGGSGPTGPPSLARNSAMLLPGLERRSAVLGPRVSPATTNMDDSTLRGPTGRPNLSRMSAPAAVLRDPPAPLPQAEGAQHLATGSSSSGKGRHGSGKRDKKPMMTALPLAPTLRVDGPYGAPTQLHEDYGVLLLIGAGIGVTPFASILHHLVNQFNEHRCSHCGQVNLTKNFPIRKVYFYWTVRDQNAASWFAAALQSISEGDQGGLLDINIHYTRARDPTDVRMTLFRVAQVTAHQQVGIDVVSGMESHVITHFGRPDFDEIMKQLAKRHNGETVGTFFCGPPVLAKTLERTCRRINKKSKTKFDFFKEHF